MIWRRFTLLVLIVMVLLASPGQRARLSPASAQFDIAPCGYVDGFDLPVELDLSRTDFGIYRARFGGLHAGIDVAFEQLGEPVRAAARGRVTFSDPAGWDTEKGVVVIQHTLPGDVLVHTVYGHMEELNGYTFPAMDACVEQGEIVGAIGFPSLGRPHLHYEVRTRDRYEGGPGYTATNPLELGWLHPLDFTFLARVWTHPAYLRHISLPEAPTQPPILLPDGRVAIVHGQHLAGVDWTGQTAWRFDTLGSVTGGLVLSDGRLVFTTSADQVLMLANGSFGALWPVPKTFVTPPIWFQDQLVFITADQTIMALTPEGQLLWESAVLPERATRWAVSGDRLAIATRNGVLWVVDTSGAVLSQAEYPDPVLPFAGQPGEFWLLSGSAVSYLDTALAVAPVFDTGQTLTASAEVLAGPSGALYLYTGEGRALYAFEGNKTLRWAAFMPGSHLRAPLLGIGGGKLVYALTTDGQLLAYDTQDGHLAGQIALYDGGVDGMASARWLHVTPEDVVSFGGGYLSLVAIDGLALVASDAPAP